MNTRYLTALLGIAVAAAPALAQQQTPPPAAPQGGGHGMRDPLARLDANGDGIITRDEAIADADRRFARFDRNGDGKITPDEMEPPMAPGAGPTPPADGSAPPPQDGGRPGGRMGGGRMMAMMLRRADADGDGTVTREEYRAVALRRFDMMDANHDGKIDAAERAAIADSMGSMGGGRFHGRRGGNGGETPPPPAPSPSSGQ